MTNKVDEAIEDFQEEGYTFLPRSNSYNEYLDVLSTLDGWVFTQDFHIPELLAFSPGTTFYNHPGYASGAIILQDKVKLYFLLSKINLPFSNLYKQFIFKLKLKI